MDFLYLILGGALLFVGGEGLLKGSVSVARQFNLSTLFIGAVVVGFGTSMPELSVSVKAAFDDAPGIVLGNVVGSNIANVLLVLGLSAALVPIVLKESGVMRDAFALVAASLALCGIAKFFGIFNLYAGLSMFGALCAYIIYSMVQDRKKPNAAETIAHVEEDIEGEPPLSLFKALVYIFVGIGLLVGGAWMFVEGAANIARSFGISEAVIGLSLVAIGTSLPELATSVVAALKRHGDVIVGNILGSGLFNILAILGLTAIIKPVAADPHIVAIDMWVMLATAVLLVPFLWTGKTISRVEGVIMLLLYCGYMGWLFFQL